VTPRVRRIVAEAPMIDADKETASALPVDQKEDRFA